MTKISYYHYGILVFPQGAWQERDMKELLTKIGQAHISDLYRTNFPTNCDLCNQIKEIFDEKLGKNEGIMYIAHLHMENDSIKKFTNLALDDERIKKFYIFQGGPVKRRGDKINLRERLVDERITQGNFIRILDRNEFQEEVLYEVVKVRIT